VVRVPGYRFRGLGFYSWYCQIIWEVLDLEQGPLSLVSTIEELLGRKSSGSGLENREYGRRDPLCWSRNTFCPQKLALTSLTSGGCSVGIVRSRANGHGVCLFAFVDSSSLESNAWLWVKQLSSDSLICDMCIRSVKNLTWLVLQHSRSIHNKLISM
jgi:hypothetical protein